MKEMATAEKIDKSKWQRGPWDAEPDRVEFEHAGLPCLMVRVEAHGAWCGYVAVLPGHILHGKGYGEPDVSVHGGLTYADKCAGRVCHTPRPGEPDDVWWFGFDTVHSGDHAPKYVESRWGGQYRTEGYVRAEVLRLAEQLAAAR